MKKGALKAFVLSHVDLSESVTEETQRLLPLAKKAHLATTGRSIEQVIYRIRKSPELRAAVRGNGHGTEPAIVVTTAREELVRGEDLVHDLAHARERLSGLIEHVQSALDVLARLEAETARRREHLQRFVTEWL